MKYELLYADFKKIFPEDKAYFNAVETTEHIDGDDGMHVLFGMVVAPFIVKLVDGHADSKLQKAFDFFEKMEQTKDPMICEVLEFTILEDFISRGKEFVDQCKAYMGPETKESYESVAKYMIE